MCLPDWPSTTSPTQPAGALKSSLSPHRFLGTQVGSAIISSEVWDETGEVSTAVTFHLQHQAQVWGKRETCHPTTLILVWISWIFGYPNLVSPYPNIHLFKPRSKLVKKKIHKPSHCLQGNGKGSSLLYTYFMLGVLNKQYPCNPPTAQLTLAKSELGGGAVMGPSL